MRAKLCLYVCMFVCGLDEQLSKVGFTDWFGEDARILREVIKGLAKDENVKTKIDSKNRGCYCLRITPRAQLLKKSA